MGSSNLGNNSGLEKTLGIVRSTSEPPLPFRLLSNTPGFQFADAMSMNNKTSSMSISQSSNNSLLASLQIPSQISLNSLQYYIQETDSTGDLLSANNNSGILTGHRNNDHNNSGNSLGVPVVTPPSSQSDLCSTHSTTSSQNSFTLETDLDEIKKEAERLIAKLYMIQDAMTTGEGLCDNEQLRKWFKVLKTPKMLNESSTQ